MRIRVPLVCLLISIALTGIAAAQDPQKPEAIVEKMSFKLVRGVTNVATAIVELPKQSIITVRERGPVGYVVGPIKGIGMTFYRAFMGAVETVAFMVPQPGYYDPMIDPEYVWQEWDTPRAELILEEDDTVDQADTSAVKE
jgi:putative exosortase-associated protein (TIGR04073 family)